MVFSFRFDHSTQLECHFESPWGTRFARSAVVPGDHQLSLYSRPGSAFANRRAAGEELARHLDKYKARKDVIVLALPRGGVPVAYEVARALDAPLDIFLVRKLGLPGHEELAMGAIASGGVRVLNADVVQWYRVPPEVIDAIARTEQAELERRERAYRDNQPPPALRDRIVVLIDDGLATGSTMKAAVQAVRAQEPARIVVAVPVGAADTCREFDSIADEIVCARSPEDFQAVGLWYQDFSQTTDSEVHALLHENSRRREPQTRTGESRTSEPRTAG
jgi:putative phosphoribosyl transferase